MTAINIGIYIRRDLRGYRAFAVGEYMNTTVAHKSVMIFQKDPDTAVLAAVQRIVEQFYIHELLDDADTNTKTIKLFTTSRYTSLTVPFDVEAAPRHPLFLTARRKGYDHYVSP